MVATPFNQKRFTQSGKHSPCPICGRTKDGDCRWNDDVSLCHSYVDQDAEVEGYIHRGATADGLWGQYFTKKPDQQKPVRPEGRKDYFYPDRDGNPLVKVVRVDKGDGTKSFYQYHWNGKNWILGLTDQVKRQVPIYRYREVMAAIAQGKQISMVEGEGCADELWGLDIAATTTLGGSKKYRSYGNYFQDLKDAQLILCPDRDQLGIGHMEDVAQDFPDAQWSYAFPSSPVWERLPKDRGLDISDWIADGATVEDILAAVGKKQHDDGRQRPNVAMHPTATRQQQPELTTEALKAKLRELIEQGASQSDIEGLVPELAEKSGRKEIAVQRLYTAVELEIEQQQSLEEDSTQFKKLIEYQTKKLDVYSIFSEPLAKGLTSKATSDRIDPVRLVQNLLPAVGGILGSKVGIVVKEGETQDDHWIERPVLWCADIGPPSSGKSNANHAMFEPIKQLQAEEANRYKQACEQLKKVEKAWESKTAEEQEELKDSQENPEVFKAEVVGIKRKWLFDVTEMEGVLRRLSEQAPSAGVIWNKDELQGLFAGLDQYKSANKGNARQILLSAWNGRIRIDVDRVKEEDSYSLGGQTLNIAGGMQPAVAREFFKSRRKGGEPDPDGLQSRILPAVPSVPDDFAVWSDVKVSIDGVLADLYAKLDKIPPGLLVFFDTQAKELWKRQWEKFKRGYLNYLDTNPAFAYFLGKMPSHLPRLALALHCIEHCFAPKQDFTKLNVDTLKRAVELASFYLGQFRLLQATTQNEEGQLSGVLLQVWNKAQKKGRLTARKAQQDLRSLKLKAPAFKEIFRSIVELGYGYLEDEGKTLVAGKNVDHVDQLLIADQHGEHLVNNGLQANVDPVDPEIATSSIAQDFDAADLEHDLPDPWNGTFPYGGDQHDQQIDGTVANQQSGDVDHGSTTDQQDQQKAEPNSTANSCQHQPELVMAPAAEVGVAQPSDTIAPQALQQPKLSPVVVTTEQVLVFQVGDRCRYAGPPGSMAVSCRGKTLKVLETRSDDGLSKARVQADGWAVDYWVLFQHLRRERQ